MTQPFDNRDWDLLVLERKDTEIAELLALVGRLETENKRLRTLLEAANETS